MRGKVIRVDEQNNLVAVLTEEDEFTIFELVDSFFQLEEGDEISGELEVPGRGIMFNETKKEDFEVFIEETHGSENTVRRLLNMR